jgi:hypothetical protein
VQERSETTMELIVIENDFLKRILMAQQLEKGLKNEAT